MLATICIQSKRIPTGTVDPPDALELFVLLSANLINRLCPLVFRPSRIDPFKSEVSYLPWRMEAGR